jgi:ParB family transcriptional regulator, chromosome partitioning protein
VNEGKVSDGGFKDLVRNGEEKQAERGEERVVLLPEESIRKNTYQPRHRFDDTSLEELARSIKEKGVIQPIIVRASGGQYELIAGERRLQAARRAGLEKVPALVREIRDKQDLLEIALIENIQREDLNPIDRARSYRRLIDEFGETQEMIGERVGKDRSTIANTLRILDLPREIKDLIEGGRLNFGQARALLALDSRELQIRLSRRAADGGLSVRELEKLTLREKFPPAGKAVEKPADPNLIYALDVLREQLKAKVTITRDRRGAGKIEIEFYSDQELARLCRLLGVRDDGAPESFAPET